MPPFSRRRKTYRQTSYDGGTRSITAAAARVRPNVDQAELAYRQTQAWQNAAFGYYDTDGACWYASQFYSRALAKVRLFAARRDEEGEIEELPGDSWAAQQFDRVKDPGGGRSQLMTSFGRLMFLIGEGYLVATETPDGEQWEFLSPSEIKVLPGGSGYARTRFPGTTPQFLKDAGEDELEPSVTEDGDIAVVYRVWRRHPMFSWLPDSPMRPVLGLFEELALLQLAVGARAKSRAAGSGILLRASEISWGSPDGQNDDSDQVDRTASRLQEAIVKPIISPGTASAVAPIILEAPADMIKEDSVLRHISLSNPLETYPEENLRAELIKRIAIGLDLPPEILLGMADANHWTAWQIDDQTWTAHLQPIVQQLCDDLGAAFLRPLARKEGQGDADELVVYYDAAEVVTHPDRAKDAKDLHDRGALSNEKLREVAGFTDDDAPSDEEHGEWLAIKLRDKSFIEQAGGVGVVEGENAEAQEGASQAGEVEPGTPDQEQAMEVEDTDVTAAAALVDRIVGAADMAQQRCRSLAGSRLVSLARKPSGCRECAERVKDMPNAVVASAFGLEQITELAATPAALVAGGADDFQATVHGWGVGKAETRKMALMIEKHAGETLLEQIPAPLPRGFLTYARRVAG